MSTRDGLIKRKPWREIGSRLKGARLAKGLTQTAVVQKIKPGKGNSWLAQLEDGSHAPKTLDDVARLADVLGVSTSWLLFGSHGDPAKTALLAIGVGGADVEVPGGLKHRDLVALWPGHWVPEHAAPMKHLVLICSPSAGAGDGWIVWKSGDRFHVGAGRLWRGQAKVTLADGKDRSCVGFGRVVLAIDPTA